jgi:LPXTG-motif cell wall-anchored protein
MKKAIELTKFLVLSILCWPLSAMAQDTIVFNDESAVFDSTLLEQQFMTEPVAKSSGSGNTTVIIVVVLIVILAAVYFILKKKKK